MRSDSDRIPILTNREWGPMFCLNISSLSLSDSSLNEKHGHEERGRRNGRYSLEYLESLLWSKMLIHPIKLSPYLHNYHQYHHRVWDVLDDYWLADLLLGKGRGGLTSITRIRLCKEIPTIISLHSQITSTRSPRLRRQQQ